MTKDRCPFCGAEIERNNNMGLRFICRTYTGPAKFDGPFTRSELCHNRQFNQLTERLEAWRGLKENLDHIVPEEGGQTEVFIDNGPLLKLRGLGEVE